MSAIYGSGLIGAVAHESERKGHTADCRLAALIGGARGR